MRFLLPLFALLFIATPAFASQQAYSLPAQTSFTVGWNYGQGGVDYPIFQDSWPNFYRCYGTVKETSVCTFVGSVGGNFEVTVSSTGLPNGQYWYRSGNNCAGITYDACRIQSGMQVDNVSVYVVDGYFQATNDACPIAGSTGGYPTCTPPVVPPTPTSTPTTTGSISFIDFNDITPTDMLASVRQGTVDTADKTLPLLVFLGIPLGFLLVLFLIGLINNTLTPETSTTSRRGNGRGWTAHGAMEHDLTEFKKKERSRIKRDL